MKKKFTVNGMMCVSCVNHVEKAALSLPGVNNVMVSLLSSSLVADYDESLVNEKAIISAITKAGYQCEVFISKAAREETARKNKEIKQTKNRLIVSIILLVPLMLVSMLPMMGFYKNLMAGQHSFLIRTATLLIELLLSISILLINRKRIFGGFKALFNKTPNMDSLVALGSTSSLLFGLIVFIIFLLSKDPSKMMGANTFLDSSGMIPVFVSIGKYIESKATAKTNSALAGLESLLPDVVIDENGIEKLIEDVKPGDKLLVKPGMSVPCDGVIVSGEGYLDESCISGESLPLHKTSGSDVVAGSINRDASFVFRVSKIGADSTIGKIASMVEKASNDKVPMAKIADRVASIFVPVVMIVSLIVLAIWMIIKYAYERTFDINNVFFPFQEAIAVLVVSCPCALGLATPIAVTISVGNASKRGIVLQSAAAFEKLVKVDTVVIDKTGTLTTGVMKVNDFKSIGESILDDVCGAERLSAHPISKAVLSFLEEKGVKGKKIKDFKNVSGKGIIADEVYIGSKEFMIENGFDISRLTKEESLFEDKGYSVIFAYKNENELAIFGVGDTLKADAISTVKKLQKFGKKVILCSGDAEKPAAYFASLCGIDDYKYRILPEDKYKVISSLKEEGHIVAMIGDGVNDSIALSSADVGIAIGSGADVAIGSSDIVLLRSSLSDLVSCFEISKRTVRNIKQNLVWAFAYNILLIPLAAGAFYAIKVSPTIFTGMVDRLVLSPFVCSIAMSLSSLTVVLNALRLKRLK